MNTIDKCVVAGIIAALVAALVALIWVGAQKTEHARVDCETRGGVFLWTRDTHICLRKEAVLP